MIKARVTVTLKNGVLDPQGKAIEHALAGLGFGGVDSVRQGKVFDIEIDGSDKTRAEADLKAALRLRQRHDAPDSLWVAQAQIVLARCQLALGRRDDAGALLASAQRTHAMHGDDARAHADALRLLVDAMSRSSTAAAGRVP